jgi:hypothetical protein
LRDHTVSVSFVVGFSNRQNEVCGIGKTPRGGQSVRVQLSFETVIVYAWRYGLQKIALTKWMRHETGCDLAVAKGATDTLLANIPIVVDGLADPHEGVRAIERLGGDACVIVEHELVPFDVALSQRLCWQMLCRPHSSVIDSLAPLSQFARGWRALTLELHLARWGRQLGEVELVTQAEKRAASIAAELGDDAMAVLGRVAAANEARRQVRAPKRE